jgi:hypothetical protein
MLLSNDPPDNIQQAVLTTYYQLDLPAKLLVFAKITHGTNFRSVNDDLLGLDKKSSAKYYQDFLERVRINLNETTQSNKTSN